MRILRIIPLAIIAVLLLFGNVGAQGPVGYTKIASVTTTTYTDNTCPDGAMCLYVITATNAVGESAPSNVVTAVIPATGTHTATLSWSAGTGGGTPTGYNVYQQKGPVPPASLTVTVN